MNKTSKTFCALPWNHLCIRPDEQLQPCCRFHPKEDEQITTSLVDIQNEGISAMNNEYWTKLRTDMLNGVPRVECIKCTVQEQSAEKRSMRTWVNTVTEKYSSNKVYTDKFNSVEMLELSLDNICNLQCKMCYSKFSTKLQLRDKFLNGDVHKKLEVDFTKLDNVDFSELKFVKVLGGEPFMTPNFVKFIDYLIQHSTPAEVTLSIITNGTLVPSDDVIEKLNKFKGLDVSVSLDSLDRANDYQRYGSSYLEIFNNATTYQKIFDKLNLIFHPTVSILTANTLANTLNILDNQLGHFVSIDYVRYPKHQSLLYAPEHVLDFVVESNKSNARAHDSVTNFLKQAKYDPDIWNATLNNIRQLDEFYKIRFEDYNKEMSEVIFK